MNYTLHCLNCNQLITIRFASEAKRRRFCGLTCAAKFNNKQHPKRRSKPAVMNRACNNCQQTFSVKRTNLGTFERYKVCPLCKATQTKKRTIAGVTKAALFSRRSNWQSARASVQKHARKIYQDSGSPHVCMVCGYNQHIEIAHRRSVSSFPKTATIEEINHLENLIPLCPNHHWEYDHGVMYLTDIQRSK